MSGETPWRQYPPCRSPKAEPFINQFIDDLRDLEVAELVTMSNWYDLIGFWRWAEEMVSSSSRKDRLVSVEVGQRLQVEVYAHGGWWKASDGRTGQVPAAEARKGPLATVAVVANRFGMDGWELIEVVSQAHSVYWLSFELAYVMEDEGEE